MDAEPCPLCGAATRFFQRDNQREYHSCCHCRLVHVPSIFHLSAAREKSEYDKHENDIHDPGYRRFLNRLCEPLLECLPRGAEGLDFGCGPGPALATMLVEKGFAVQCYDKFYCADTAVLQRKYDFITATEVVEHLPDPGAVLDRIWSLLRPGGHLGIMTKRLLDAAAFSRWHYKNDPTHIGYFHEQTFVYLAKLWCAQLEFPGADTVILRKPGPTPSV